ncbi:hypothetical protein FIBSPDRAFT_948647 [Athelia psychrophila]|uniref:Uncharacterized protein n=1 Tax=Athelia psychrophila TaxID=1759441 RepID=A0A166QNY4_9AGAM|nr:hypothetical protein FIBSPDRAFT_948647 [Fibularhizoctonia sp. CBS 109695]
MCRTFTQIIQPAVTALIAANYLSVHMNVPWPMLPWYWKVYRAAKVFLVVLMFPDWIFIWALRNFIVVLRARDRLKAARASAHSEWAAHGDDPETPPPWRNRTRFFTAVDKTDGTPMFPLDVDTTIMLITNSRILLPRKETIEGLSKTTYLGQSFAAFELSVFLLKCVRRLVEGLPLANLEVMAFVHASIVIFTFIPWWYKLMALDEPMCVPIESVESVTYTYIFGNQESLYTLCHLRGVPTFWSGDPDNIFVMPQLDEPPPSAPEPAYFLASAAGIPFIVTFGLIHWLASSSNTPATEAERVLWHGAAIAITVVPTAPVLGYLLTVIPILLGNDEWQLHIMIIMMVLTGTAYVVAQVILLAVTCISLHRMPFPVYQTGNLPEFFH